VGVGWRASLPVPPPPAVPAARSRKIRRRRVVAMVVTCAVVAAVVLLVVVSTSHHVHVVRVVSVKRPPPANAIPSASGVETSPQAPSDRQVEKELHQAEAASTGGTSVGSGGSPLGSGASGSFAQLRRSVPDRVQIAIAPLASRHVEVLGGNEAGHGWSTTKVPVLAALIKARGSRGLTTTERGLAESAITASDNGSILSLFSDLERIKGGLVGASHYVESLFRLSGDTNSVVATGSPPAGAATTFGQTLWTPTDSVKFFSALARGCLLSPTQTAYVLGLMRNIESSESWGLGSAGFSTVAFKGGWGPEAGGYLVRQSGIVNVGTSRAVAVSIVAFPSGSASFSDGVETLTQAAVWLRHNLRPSSGRNLACPGA
jgi:hypothetical protein